MEKTVTGSDILKAIANAANNVPPPSFGQVGAAMVNLMGGTLNISALNDVLQESDTKNEISESSVSQSKGFLVSSDDLKNIFLYVDTALNLPRDKENAEYFLGYKSNDPFFEEESHKFLSPQQQVDFDIPIIEHAKLWSGLEQSIKNIGNSLNNYASVFVTNADGILEVLDDLSKYMKTKGILDADGNDIVDCGSDMLRNWKRDTEANKEKSVELYNRLTAFYDTLVSEISVKVKQRVNKINDMHISEEQKNLQTKINELNKSIKSLKDEYDKNVGLAFTGAAGIIIPPVGIITWAVTGGVYGAKAEKIRKQMNDKKEERAPLQKQLDAINRVIGGINSLESSLIDFQTSISCAITGLEHINTIWDSIVNDITGALDKINQTSDAEYTRNVKTLITNITVARNEWEKCGDVTKELVEQFDRARREHNRSR